MQPLCNERKGSAHAIPVPFFFFLVTKQTEMQSVCPDDESIRDIASMNAMGFAELSLVGTEQRSVGCVTAVTETYRTQTGRGSLSTGGLTALEPTDNEGIFRGIPRNSRISSIDVTLIQGTVAALTSNETLRFVLTKRPYASSTSADDVELMQLNNKKDATMSSTPVEISFGTIAWLGDGDNGSFRVVGRPTKLDVLATRLLVGHTRCAHYAAEERYPALLYTSTSTPAKQLPADVAYHFTVEYEVVRSPDAADSQLPP
jgi:hypothetical protein